MSTEPIFNYLELAKNLTEEEKQIEKSFIDFLKANGMDNIKPQLKLNEDNENERVFKVQSISYEENGETVYRNPMCKDKLYDTFEGYDTICEVFEKAAKDRKEDEMIGYRQILSEEVSQDKTGKSMIKLELSDYHWLTIEQVKRRVDYLSSFYIDNTFSKDDKVAFFLDTSPLWFISAYALFQISVIPVTIFPSLSDNAIIYALNLANVKGIILDNKSATRIAFLLPKIPCIKFIFITDDIKLSGKDLNLDEKSEVKIIRIDISKMDKEIDPTKLKVIAKSHPSPDRIALIMYTSGSTGDPKGVIITHQNILSSVANFDGYKPAWDNRLYCAWLPLSHILEFMVETVIWINGGKLGFGNSLTIFNNSPMIKEGTRGDFVALKPTMLSGVPLILERVKSAFIDRLKTLPRVDIIKFQTAYNIKLNYLKVGLETPLLDKLVFYKNKELFGGAIDIAYIGGALLNQETEEFYNICFFNTKQALGSTEAVATGTMQKITYMTPNCVGTVSPGLELKLVSWEEGKYYANDLQGPKGEIWLSGKSICMGYYGQTELTNESFVFDDKTGKRWYKTGDIGMLLPDKTFRLIDRKKDIVKLEHGEFVALSNIEKYLSKCRFVEVICICPNSSNNKLFGLIIPNRPEILNLAKELQLSDNIAIEEIVTNEQILNYIKAELLNIAVNAKCNKYEIPEKFFILTDSWTPENGMLTPSSKIRRFFITSHYRELLI